MTRRPVLPAAFAAVLLVVGQLVAFAHEANTRHFTCAKHGELLEAAVMSSARAPHACQNQHWGAVEGNGGSHTDCAIARTLQQSTTRATNHVLASVAIAIGHADTPPVAIHHNVGSLFRIAPKTSPP